MLRPPKYFDDRSFDKYFDDCSFDYIVKDKTCKHGHLEPKDTHFEEDVLIRDYKKSQAIPAQPKYFSDRSFYDSPKDETYGHSAAQFATEKARHEEYKDSHQAAERQAVCLQHAHEVAEQKAARLRNARLAEVMERRRQREEDETIRLELEEQEWVREETEKLKEHFRKRKIEQEEEEQREETQWKTWKQERQEWKEQHEWQEVKKPNLGGHSQRQEQRFKDSQHAEESTPRNPWSSSFYPWTGSFYGFRPDGPEPQRKENRRDSTPKQQQQQAQAYTSQLPPVIQIAPTTYSPSTDYLRWTAACESMHTTFKFPDPPAYKCGLALKRPNACMNRSTLQGCEHDLEKMLRESGEYGMGFLRKLTIMFHPDKFFRWPEEGGVRKRGQEKAKEMFQLLRRLMEAKVRDF
ncbi:LIM and calponin domains-containing protein 1 [Varicellaria rhodocarpa]|nr:LIM and calponin domains-containing protein 1 [Varicellaria rhodocarpa]